LEVAQRLDEFLDHSEVRAQPPEQQNQQQGNQGDNYQVLQIPFSAVMRRIMMALAATKPGPDFQLLIFAPSAAFSSRIGRIIFATARKRIDVTAARR
jgi:hypothetical protein